MKLFSIRVKELFEPIVFAGEKKPTGLALSKKHLLENRSLSIVRLFYGKKRKIRRRNLFSLKID